MNNKTYNVSKVDLKNKKVREDLSYKMKSFESEFNYPLGNSTFKIEHGSLKGKDYFSYFENLGVPYFYIVEKGNNVIGSVCLVLKKIEDDLVWYICDLKIKKEDQSNKLVFLMYSHIKDHAKAITDKFYFVNMSPIKNNGILKIAKKVMPEFNVKTQNLFIHTLTKKEIGKSMRLCYTTGEKDIVIEGEVMPLYHVVANGNKRLDGVNVARLDEIEENATIMLARTEKINGDLVSNLGLIGMHGIARINDFSTFEI